MTKLGIFDCSRSFDGERAAIKAFNDRYGNRFQQPLTATHKLKIDVEAFNAVVQNIKTSEVRQNDRDFKVGDVLHLREIERDNSAGELVYTGRSTYRTISHIQMGYGLPDGLCVLSFAVNAVKGQVVWL